MRTTIRWRGTEGRNRPSAASGLVEAVRYMQTTDFSSRLVSSRPVNRQERRKQVKALLHSFGLSEQAETLIGTPIQKRISRARNAA
ncbi:hypothetical protein XA68_10367 [Ophiocordyceps unilateralis]|uniref:Uncharacterized protein n=1 Tax=Ophiocordyceps unilateralis TaxID=268505 RepID=A0A2A9PIP1_OPHUN|nr:hypothetical protein XA68_10367 [Ophiocordyceps unilateralis]